jgi:hypothetical protein
MVDEAGNPVHSQEALRIKAETLELLGALPPIVPALDAIISRFGTMPWPRSPAHAPPGDLARGSQRLESRTANQSLADANAFMGGAKRILVFSDAGGTGRSYHASLDAKNQQRRMHFCWSRAGAPTAPSRGLAGPTAPIRHRRRCSAPSPPIAAASGVSSRPSPAASMRLAR